jgi:hypothetical protein
VFDYEERRRHAGERMQRDGVRYLAPSADLEYLTGIRRDIQSFGESSYAALGQSSADDHQRPPPCQRPPEFRVPIGGSSRSAVHGVERVVCGGSVSPGRTSPVS